jgi:hypothetical protein
LIHIQSRQDYHNDGDPAKETKYFPDGFLLSDGFGLELVNQFGLIVLIEGLHFLLFAAFSSSLSQVFFGWLAQHVVC